MRKVIHIISSALTASSLLALVLGCALISETSWAAEPLTDGGCTDCNGGCNPCGGVCETGSDCTNNCTCESDPHYYVCCLPPPLVCDPAEELEESFCEPGS